MTTQIQILDENWLNISASLLLTPSTEYLLQNAGPVTVFIQEAASPPAVDDVGRRLLPNTSSPIFVTADNFYARTEKLGSRLIVDFGGGSVLNPVAGLFASQYDGTNDYQLRGADLTGNVDGKKYLASFFLRLTDPELAAGQIIFGPLVNTGFTLDRAFLNKDIFVKGFDSSGVTQLGSLSSPTTVEADGVWHHVLVSGDLASPGSGRIYIDDVETTDNIIFNDVAIDYTQPDHAIGARPDGSRKLHGSLSEVYINLAENLDLTVEANRRLFITAGLEPVFLGVTGAGPTGTPPIIFAPNGDASNNRGTGGNFTTMGSLNSVSGPGV